MAQLLILEPDRPLAVNLKNYFKSAGYSVQIHGDPQAALSAADQLSPDVVIAELQLAGRSGVEFLYEFRSYSDWQNTPIIIFTNLHPEQMAEYHEALADLNVSASLYKTQAGLADLLWAVGQSAPLHAKV